MRAYGLILSCLSCTALVASCTDDLDAPYNYQLGTTTGAGTLEVGCGEIPDAAVGAQFAHTLEASGGEGPYTFTAGLPAGLVLDASTGEISGTPTTAGQAMFDVTVTDTNGDTGTASCVVEVNEHIALDLALDAVPFCLQGTDTLQAHVVPGTGDGTPITCDHTNASGNGKIPAGLSVGADDCAVTGTLGDTRLGTWAFVVRGTQSGAEVYIPYCVTNDTPAADTYPIVMDHSGQVGQTLQPLTRTFNPDAVIAVGTPGDPLVTVTDNGDCPGASCSYSFQFFINASPFDLKDGAGNDKAVVVDDMLGDDGTNDTLSHGLRLSTNDAVDEGFKTRPWVVNLDLDYCFGASPDDCDTAMNPTFNAFLELSVIMVPTSG